MSHERMENQNKIPDSNMIFECFPVGHLQCNCSIVADPVSKKGIVIDPGGDPELIQSVIAKHSLTITDIIHTHAHYDHIIAAGDIKKITGASIGLHKEDKFLWDMLETQCQMFGLPYNPVPETDYFIKDNHDLKCCGGVALHAPGHTQGSTSFWFEHSQLLIAGDTLFKRSIGRTDLWGGDFELIQKSIRERLYTLDDKARVITGHGPETILGEEKTQNPFVKQ